MGRDPIAHEAPLLERCEPTCPRQFDLMADGNAAYTFAGAVEMGRVLERLGFVWFEEPMRQREGYAGYERLTAALDIALAAGEMLQNRGRPRDFLARACSTSSSPSR